MPQPDGVPEVVSVLGLFAKNMKASGSSTGPGVTTAFDLTFASLGTEAS